MKHESVLKRLLKRSPETQMIEDVLKGKVPEKVSRSRPRRGPGRPKVSHEKKARNFTLCLAPQFVEFIDRLVVKDPKVRGRGRKIRFIIERFLEHEKRSIGHMKILKNTLLEVQSVLETLGPRVRRGEKLELTAKEKSAVSKAVDQVHVILHILHYSPKTLSRMLPPGEWATLSFCLNWKNHRGVVI